MAQTSAIPATVTLPVGVTAQDLFYLFSAALEGGIGYWSCATEYHWRLPDGETDLDGFYAEIEETESGEDTPPVHRIDAACIMRGLMHFAAPGEGYRHVRQVARALLLGEDADYDAADADCIVQAGLFDGEVVYG